MKPQMFAQLISADDGRPVSSSDLVAEVESEVRRPLRELKWFAGLAQSRGRLHPDLVGEATFMLTQAPGEAMENDRFARLARILIRAPMGVEELHRESGEAAENIAAFLNACYTTGQLLVSRQAEVVGYGLPDGPGRRLSVAQPGRFHPFKAAQGGHQLGRRRNLPAIAKREHRTRLAVAVLNDHRCVPAAIGAQGCGQVLHQHLV